MVAFERLCDPTAQRLLRSWACPTRASLQVDEKGKLIVLFARITQHAVEDCNRITIETVLSWPMTMPA